MEYAPKSRQSNSTGVNGGHKFSVVKHGREGGKFEERVDKELYKEQTLDTE